MTDSKKGLEDYVLVTHDPISCDAAAQTVRSDSAGATSMFIGECDAIDETVGECDWVLIEDGDRLTEGVTVVMSHSVVTIL